MPNFYIFQPIQVHQTKELQDFRRGDCEIKPQNTYLRKSTAGGYQLYLPNIEFLRETSGADLGISLWTTNDVSVGSMESPGFSSVPADDPVGAYEIATFDRGYWDLPLAVEEGDYYLRFSPGGGVVYWTDAIHIIESQDGDDLQNNRFPPQCAGRPWAKLRWSDPMCIYSGKSTDDKTNIIAYAPGSDFFIFWEGASLIDAEWQNEPEYGPIGSGGREIVSRFAQKRWKLKGAPVSAAVVDAMQASAFFSNIRLYFEGMDDALFQCSDVIVTSNTPDGGCSYDVEYTFTAGYLSKQGCCAE